MRGDMLASRAPWPDQQHRFCSTTYILLIHASSLCKGHAAQATAPGLQQQQKLCYGGVGL